MLISLFFIVDCNNQHIHYFENYQCECGEKEELTITLIDNDNTTLVKVKYGQIIDSSYFEVNNNYFFNSEEYKDKWYILSSYE